MFLRFLLYLHFFDLTILVLPLELKHNFCKWVLRLRYFFAWICILFIHQKKNITVQQKIKEKRLVVVLFLNSPIYSVIETYIFCIRMVLKENETMCSLSTPLHHNLPLVENKIICTFYFIPQKVTKLNKRQELTYSTLIKLQFF